MATTRQHLIAARKGVAHRVRRYQVVKVINTYGSQVVDFWAFDAADLGECMSMEHTRTAIGLERVVHPCPFNLFMNIPVRDGVEVSFEPPVSRPGDAISFRVEMDAVVAFSACPQDMVPINGKDCVVRDAHFEIQP